MISDEAVEAAVKVIRADTDKALTSPLPELIRTILEAAAPYMLAAVADERDEGDLFRFTISQREWLRSNPYRSQP